MSLDATGLSLKRGGASILDAIALSLPTRGSVAVIGANGAGKSSLLRVLSGLQPPTTGKVLLRGMDIARLPSALRARTIGFLPQYFEPHWDLTVAELLRLGADRATDLPASATAETAATYELAPLLGRRWSTLSGGERARTLLAMVLVVEPTVLLADEPAAALDIRHRLDVMQALAARGRERLSVVVVHDLDLAFSFFERIVLMNAGRILADASADELVNDPRLDQAFAVRFERLRTEDGWHLRARR
jgi:iron complex transport system ATP-binding protein